ncbi:MAG: hypothetical protein FWE02_05380 [Defluviitaleaceae bacterium]|nr:hypothetical protein [Defluviitaleaceae bacterium]
MGWIDSRFWGSLAISIFQKLKEVTDFENLSMDSTSVKAHQYSAGAKKISLGMQILRALEQAVEAKQQKSMQS